MFICFLFAAVSKGPTTTRVISAIVRAPLSGASANDVVLFKLPVNAPHYFFFTLKLLLMIDESGEPLTP